MATTMWVRLKPYDPARGHVCKLRRVSGVPFEQGKWMPLDMSKPGRAQLVEALRVELQHVGNPKSDKAFDVCTESERKALIMEEQAVPMRALLKRPTPRLQPPKKIDLTDGEMDGAAAASAPSDLVPPVAAVQPTRALTTDQLKAASPPVVQEAEPDALDVLDAQEAPAPAPPPAKPRKRRTTRKKKT
ncbi:MAG: hypothetical protein GTN69_06900 [Armatimonadetes bacterium]|nr:hypothetical protein [Armatimonadota bacterium]